eukprot:3025405-Rhodomonas_salina.2
MEERLVTEAVVDQALLLLQVQTARAVVGRQKKSCAVCVLAAQHTGHCREPVWTAAAQAPHKHRCMQGMQT